MDVAVTAEHAPPGEDAAANGQTTTVQDNKFQRAIAAWRSIDLTNLIPKLDATASELANQQKDSLVERKELAQKTKDFRKLDGEAKITEVKALLKCIHNIPRLRLHAVLTYSCSISNIHRPRFEPLQVYLLSIPASVLSSVRSTRSIPTARGLRRFLDRRR